MWENNGSNENSSIQGENAKVDRKKLSRGIKVLKIPKSAFQVVSQLLPRGFLNQ